MTPDLLDWAGTLAGCLALIIPACLLIFWPTRR